ncbi:MAG: hypothetical protein ACQEQC_04990 [Elusimicrobiota bacterium]
MINKTKFLVVLYLLTFPARVLAVERLNEAMNLFLEEHYEKSLKKVKSYISDNPADELGQEMARILNERICQEKLKMGFTLIHAGRMNEANRNLDEALSYDSEYANKIEEKYIEYLEEYDREKASDEVLYYLLEHPRPPESQIHAVNREVRKKYIAETSDLEDVGFEELNNRITVLRKEQEWEDAMGLLRHYIEENPGHSRARKLLSEVEDMAARDYYSRAVTSLENEEYKKGRNFAQKSRNLNEEWYKTRVNSKLKEAQDLMATGQEQKARAEFEMLEYLAPDNSVISSYLGILDENEEELFDKGMELYNNKIFDEATVRFDLLRLRQPDNNKAQMYYHLASARHSIRNRDIENVRKHLIRALRLEPNNQEAMEIFDRLQDVLEIMG